MPTRSFPGLKIAPLVTCVLLAVAGCTGETGPNAPPPGPGPAAGFLDPDPPAETTGGTPTIKQIMSKLTKGPNSLTLVIGKELEADAPDWNTIQPQTDEFARLAAALAQNKPRKGSLESWTELSAAFGESADTLSKAANAKNRDAALEAHNEIAGSCRGCHRQHRTMGPGMGKMGGSPPLPGGPGRAGGKRAGPG